MAPESDRTLEHHQARRNDLISKSDQFWGFIRDVTAIAGQVLFGVLDAEPGSKRGRSPVFRFGDGSECYFELDQSGGNSVFLVNESPTLTCTCTFTKLSGGTVSTEYVSVGPRGRREVTSTMLAFVDGGRCGLNAVDASLVADPEISPILAATISVLGLAVGTAIVFKSVNTSVIVTPKPDELIIDNPSPFTYNWSASFKLPFGIEATWTMTGTVGPHSSIQAAYPDGAQVPQNDGEFEEMDFTVLSGQQSVKSGQTLTQAVGQGLGPYVITSISCSGPQMVLTAVDGKVVLSEEESGKDAQQWYLFPVVSITGEKYVGFVVSNSPTLQRGTLSIEGKGKDNDLTLSPWDSNDPDFVWTFFWSEGANEFYIENFRSVKNDNIAWTPKDFKCDALTPLQLVDFDAKNHQRFGLVEPT